MYYLHLDDMLEVARQHQAELHRQAAQEALVAQIGDRAAPRWPAALARLWATITQRPHLQADRVLVPELTDSSCCC